MTTKEFSELLKGCRPVKDNDGNIIVQSILNMQIVCLTTDDEFSLDDRFANPLTSLVASNSSYGEIVFSNTGNKEVIIPTQMAVITEQSAQNHAMTKAGYIDSQKTITYDDAGCVEGSRGGYFHNTSEYRMLPVTIREMAFNAANESEGYSRLYPAIRKLGVETKSDTAEYVDKYYSKYDKKLEQFIAHFERPKKLIGTIVLVDGEIIAIDKFPSFTYAEQVWDIMIRDCYGALAIISELNNKSCEKIFTDIFNRIGKVGKMPLHEKLRMSLNSVKMELNHRVEEKITDILDIVFDVNAEDEDSNANVKSYMLKSEGYLGQLISESNYNHLVSIIKKDSYDVNAMRIVNELRNKAKRQQRFSL